MQEWPRILTSSKFQGAWIITGLGFIQSIFVLTDSGVSRTDKQAEVETTFRWVAGAWITAGAVTGVEDGLTNHGKGAVEVATPPVAPPAPEAKSDVTVNVAGQAGATGAPPTQTAAAPPGRPARPASNVVIK